MRAPSRSRQLTKISAPFITWPRSGPEDFAEREESFLDFIAVKHSKIPTIVRTEQLQERRFLEHPNDSEQRRLFNWRAPKGISYAERGRQVQRTLRSSRQQRVYCRVLVSSVPMMFVLLYCFGRRMAPSPAFLKTIKPLSPYGLLLALSALFAVQFAVARKTVSPA
jgi:hypothetical protein